LKLKQKNVEHIYLSSYKIYVDEMTASPHANEYKVYQIQKKERSLKTRALDKSSFLDNEF